MKKYFVSIILLAITNIHASDIYNGSNGQLTIPSVNVAGTNYNNVVINVGGIVKIGGTGGFAVQNFAKNLYSNPTTTVIKATDNSTPPNQYVMTLNNVAVADVTFEGQAVNVINSIASLTINNVSAGSFTTANYFKKGDLNTQVGQSDGENYYVYSNMSNPANLKNISIGDFGFLNSSIVYSDSSKKIIRYYSVFEYSLEQSSDANSAYICNIENQFNPTKINDPVNTNKFCFQVDNSGAFTGGVNAILNINNTKLNFTGVIK